MAMLNVQNDFKEDQEHFKKLYDMTYEEFINYYGDDDNITIDLTDKVVVSVCMPFSFKEPIKHPVEILGIFIPECERLKYKATLIYSGHVAFIKCEWEDGSVRWFYKDDECSPETYEEFKKYSGDIFYECKENGFDPDVDVLKMLEMFIQVNFDFRYKLDPGKLVVLEGL